MTSNPKERILCRDAISVSMPYLDSCNFDTRLDKTEMDRMKCAFFEFDRIGGEVRVTCLCVLRVCCVLCWFVFL